MGTRVTRLPAAKVADSGNTSPARPNSTADSAVPPQDADWMKPRMALRFSSGSAYIMVALKIALPTALVMLARHARMHRGRNWGDR